MISSVAEGILRAENCAGQSSEKNFSRVKTDLQTLQCIGKSVRRDVQNSHDQGLFAASAQAAACSKREK